MPDRRFVAPGHLISDLAEDEWRILDDFESDLYELRSVMTQDQTAAWACALNDDGDVFWHRWDSDKFARDSLDQYLDVCSRWRQQL